MKTFLMTAATLSLVLGCAAGGAQAKTIANPPTAAQLTAFYAACVKVAPEATVLCKCKEEAAPKIIDADFMKVVIDSMNGKPTPVNDTVAYDKYIAASTKACGMGSGI